MRVFDLEQGRSVERLDGHARIKPLPTKLFIPGQRVFTPRYRLFIPSSTNLRPAVILRFDRRLERTVARPLCCRLCCRETKPGRGEDRRNGLSPQVLSVRRAGRAAIRSGGRTSSGSKTASVKTPRSSGFWLMRNGPPRSGSDVAVRAAPLRQGPSATGFRPAYHNARAEGRAINHEKMQCLWREEGLGCHTPPAQRPRQLHRTAEGNRGCTNSDVRGGHDFDVTTDG
jgi:hypothetical protein